MVVSLKKKIHPYLGKISNLTHIFSGGDYCRFYAVDPAYSQGFGKNRGFLHHDAVSKYIIVVSYFWHFHLYLGRVSKLIHIFQTGWNHQLNTYITNHPHAVEPYPRRSPYPRSKGCSIFFVGKVARGKAMNGSNLLHESEQLVNNVNLEKHMWHIDILWRTLFLTSKWSN